MRITVQGLLTVGQGQDNLHFLGNFAVLLGNFKFQTIIWPLKSLNRKNKDDNFIALVICGFPMNSKRCLKYLHWEEINDISLKSFTGQNSGLKSYFKTILESWISGQKVIIFGFSLFPFFAVKLSFDHVNSEIAEQNANCRTNFLAQLFKGVWGNFRKFSVNYYFTPNQNAHN